MNTHKLKLTSQQLFEIAQTYSDEDGEGDGCIIEASNPLLEKIHGINKILGLVTIDSNGIESADPAESPYCGGNDVFIGGCMYYRITDELGKSYFVHSSDKDIINSKTYEVLDSLKKVLYDKD